MDASTFKHRKVIMDIFDSHGYPTSQSTDFKSYLTELKQHRFCLCLRGNGLDTHRFYESLLMGTIPVIVNNKLTNMGPFVENLKSLGLPFIEKDELDDCNFCEYNFSQENYDRIINDHPDYLKKLTLGYYF